MTGYICKYAPIELLKAFGEEVRLVNPMADSLERADGIIHQNVCSFCRSLIQHSLEEKAQTLLLTDCCDSVRRTYDVLLNEGRDVLMLTLPRKRGSMGKHLFAQALLRLSEQYRERTGNDFDLESFYSSFEKSSKEAKGSCVALMGARVGDELRKAAIEASPLPVIDYTCTGYRQVKKPPRTGDFQRLIEWYAKALMSQTPCMRMTDYSPRSALTDRKGLKGVIYHTVKFCDFYGFEYAQLKNTLDIPILKIESDYTLRSSGQLSTRLEALFESLPIDKPEKKGAAFEMKDAVYTAGIDSGSTSTNVVILDKRKNIVSFAILPTGARVSESADKAFDEALKRAGLKRENIARTVTTGYGRAGISERERDVTEITCHAKGAYFLNPAVRTVIDIGGQDSKVIRIDEKGAVKGFVMNDKCAAGTGRFLEMMARSLGLELEQMSTMGLSWNEEITISSMCSVFAESEVVSLIADGKDIGDIVHGINMSIASKMLSLTGRAGLEGEYMMTGGVAKNAGVVSAIEQKLGCSINVPKEPEICGALGAALIAAEDLEGL